MTSSLVEQHIPCPCGKSSDAYCTYDDGHGHCFSCGDTFHGDTPTNKQKGSTSSKRDLIPFDHYAELTSRGISEETCQKYGYFVARDKGKTVQVAPYRRNGQVVGQKVRGANKQFYTTGDFIRVELFGQHLWKNGGKRIVITEGEIDALSAQQMLGSWPVVSLPNGAQSAAKSISENMQFLGTYEKVILCFDQDDPGREAVESVTHLFRPGTLLIMELPLKDANEMLQEGLVKEFVSAFWEAREFRPDGIVTLSDIRDRVLTPPEQGLPWWLDTLNGPTYGRRFGETYAFGAGTGIGKTDFLTQQIQHDVDVLGLTVGLFMLEQNPTETAKRVAGKFAGKRFHVPDGSWTQEELVGVIDRLTADNRIFFYDNFGATEWSRVASTIRYLNHAHGVRVFYLDHLTALAAAEENEKEGLERIMAEMAMLAKELDVIIHFVSHLTTPDGKPHEEGGRVTIRHFKGSRAIGFWSHFMFGLERNTQAEDLEERNRTTFRVLKDRFTGDANGFTTYLGYEKDHGLLVPCAPPSEDLLDDGQDF